MTATNKILNALKQGRYLNKIEMLNEFGVLNGGYPIFLLRQRGHDIRKSMRKNKATGKIYADYFLVAENVRRVF